MARGKVLFPDAQIEYVTAAGAGRRCNVEVPSEHYGGGGTKQPQVQEPDDLQAPAERCVLDHVERLI